MVKESSNKNEKSKIKPQENIQSLAQLKDWLSSRGIDISQWGRGKAKRLECLWSEIANEEVSIQDQPTIRIVPVVQVIIRRGQKILIEAKQEFNDKRIRSRNRPPSEKIRQGESYIEAAIRCLQEELDLERQNIKVIPSTYHQTQQERDALSYPGLYTRYIFHIVEARVSGLPDTDFWTNESAQNKNDPVRRHHWVWRVQTDESYGTGKGDMEASDD